MQTKQVREETPADGDTYGYFVSWYMTNTGETSVTYSPTKDFTNESSSQCRRTSFRAV